MILRLQNYDQLSPIGGGGGGDVITLAKCNYIYLISNDVT